MKNLNSLLARLSALSLAAAMTFSAAEAATARKDPKAAKAVIEALVAKTLANDESKAITTPGGAVTAPAANKFTTIDTPLIIGNNKGTSQNANLLVFGGVRSHGDLVVGSLGTPKLNADNTLAKDSNGNVVFTTPGLKNVVGIAQLDPHKQELRIAFKTKKGASHGAFVSLDFVTTATTTAGDPVQDNDAVVGLSLDRLFCHPGLDATQIATQDFDTPGGTDALKTLSAAKAGDSAFVINKPDDTEVGLDFQIFKNVTSKDVSIRFIPANADFRENGKDKHGNEVAHSDFFGDNWLQVGKRVVYAPGTLSYQVASGDLIHVAVAGVNDQGILPADIFDLFSDDELTTLLGLLNDYFAGNTTKMREYLLAHRHQLSRAFKSVR